MRRLEDTSLSHMSLNSILLTPTGREKPCISDSDTRLLPEQEEEKTPPCPVIAQPMEVCQNSAKKKSLYFELSVSLNGLFVYNSFSQVQERAFLVLFLWTCT